MIRQKESNNILPIFIWTEADRLCRQCRNEPAQPNDWLCHSCRHTLEHIWQTLPLTPKMVVKRHVMFNPHTA